MSGQLEQMKSSSFQTDQLIYAARLQAKAATDAAGAATKNATAAEDFARAAKTQVTEMNNLAVAAKNQATAAAEQLETMRRQLSAFETIEGAHIGVGRYQGSISQGRIGIPLENYGRIPSPRTFVFVHVYKFAGTDERPFYSKDHEFGGDRTEIPPGTGKYGVTVPLDLREGELERIEAGVERLVIFTVVRYDNGFGKMSQPGFCFTYSPRSPTLWDACGPVVSFEDLQRMQKEKK